MKVTTIPEKPILIQPVLIKRVALMIAEEVGKTNQIIYFCLMDRKNISLWAIAGHILPLDFSQKQKNNLEIDDYEQMRLDFSVAVDLLPHHKSSPLNPAILTYSEISKPPEFFSVEAIKCLIKVGLDFDMDKVKNKI